MEIILGPLYPGTLMDIREPEFHLSEVETPESRMSVVRLSSPPARQAAGTAAPQMDRAMLVGHASRVPIPQVLFRSP
jgi:hypothetical protein